MILGTGYAAIMFAAGVFASEFVGVPPALIFAASYFAVEAARSAFARRTSAGRIMMITAFIFGIVLGSRYSSPSMCRLSAYEDKYVTVTGRVCEIPNRYERYSSYVVDARLINMDGAEEEIREPIIVSSPDSYELGDSVCFSGFVEEIDEKLNERGFDMKRYYKSKRLFYRCYAMSSRRSDMKIAAYSVRDFALRLNNSISRLLDKYTRGDKNALLKAVILNEKKDFSDEYYAVLERTGTMRFFYPAFMHVMLITALIGLLSCIMNKKRRDAAAVVFLLVYAAAASAYPVVLKGCLVAAALIVFQRVFGHIYFADVLGAAVLVIGIANPLIFYDAGFVMSVTASLIISMFYEPLTKRIKIKNRYFKRMLAAGIICTVGLLPLCAFYFRGVTPYTIVTSFVFMPATFVILALSPFALAMLALFGAAPVVGQLMAPAVWIYMKVPYIIDALPFSNIPLPEISLVTIAAFYTGVYGFYLLCRKRRFGAVLSAVVGVSLFASVLAREIPRLKTAEFTFVNVGQGDGALVRTPYRDAVLIDGGGSTGYSGYDAGEEIYLPYLESTGIISVDCAIVSHCHGDHAGGITAAIKNMRVRHLYIPETPTDNEVYRELFAAAQKYGTQVHIVKEITRLRFKSGLTVMLFPPPETAFGQSGADDENDNSMLVRVSYGETDCYFTGDMPAAEEFAIAAAGWLEETEILKVAHHGSDTSSSKIFLDAVRPEYAVISVGEENSYGLPSARTLERLDGTKIFRTDKNGDITFTADKSGIIDIKTYK